MYTTSLCYVIYWVISQGTEEGKSDFSSFCSATVILPDFLSCGSQMSKYLTQHRWTLFPMVLMFNHTHPHNCKHCQSYGALQN